LLCFRFFAIFAFVISANWKVLPARYPTAKVW